MPASIAVGSLNQIASALEIPSESVSSKHALADGAPRAFDSALLARDGDQVTVRIALARLGDERDARGAMAVVTRLL